MLKINLGCGPGGIEGWVNYDWGILPLVSKYRNVLRILVKLGVIDGGYMRKWPNFRLFDIRKRFKEKKNSADYIYCSQVLEHFDKWEAIGVCGEVYRILKPGGVFRVAVPDVKKQISIYQRDGNSDNFAKNIWGFEKNLKPKSWLRGVARRFVRDHQWLYDVESMKVLLAGVGFGRVRVVSFRRGVTPDIERLDLIDHRPTSMYLEAYK